MTLESLHAIIQLEEELLANENAEHKKADLWIKVQQDALSKQHIDAISSLEKKIEEEKNRTEAESNRRANNIIQEAERKADQLTSKNDDALKKILLRKFNDIIGRVP